MLVDLCYPSLSNKISFMKTIVSLCCVSKMFMSKDTIYAFSLKTQRCLTCYVHVFQLLIFFWKYSPNWKSALCGTLIGKSLGIPKNYWNLRRKDFGAVQKRNFWKGFGNTQEDVFISCLSIKLECIYFWCVFLSMGGFLLFDSNQ